MQCVPDILQLFMLAPAVYSVKVHSPAGEQGPYGRSDCGVLAASGMTLHFKPLELAFELMRHWGSSPRHACGHLQQATSSLMTHLSPSCMHAMPCTDTRAFLVCEVSKVGASE